METTVTQEEIFLRMLTTSLTIPYIKDTTKLPLKSITLSAVNNVLQSSVTANVEEHKPVEVMPDGKCHICLKTFIAWKIRKGAEEKQT